MTPTAGGEDAVSRIDLIDMNVLVGPLPQGNHAHLDRERLAVQMERFGIATSVVHHTWARYGEVVRGNAAAREFVAGDDALLAGGVLVPPDTGELGSDADVDDLLAGSPLLVCYPASHGWRLGGYEARGLLERVADTSRALLVPVDETTLDEVEEVARRHPRLPLVLSRVGYRNLRRLTALLSLHESVYCDLSFFAAHQGMEQFLERFGRIPFVYASASPVCDPAGSVARLRWSGLETTVQTLVASGHAERLLGLVAGDRNQARR